MPYKNGNIVWNATVWTDKMIADLKENWRRMTNRELATYLGTRLTVTRNKLRELGLKRMDLEYWNAEIIEFLKSSYRTMGDVEIMNFFKKFYPKNKGWKKGAIWKKRKQMGLIRTEEEKKILSVRNMSKGGPCYTIDRNSSSKNFHPNWVLTQIAWRNPALKKELKNHPDIIEAARKMYLLKRKIREHEKQAI